MATQEVVVSQVVRRSAASSVVATLAALTFGGGSVAQAPAALPLDPADPARCGTWSTTPGAEPAGGRSRSAMATGQGVAVAAVDVEPVTPTCNLSSEDLSLLGIPFADAILERDPEAGLFGLSDEAIDAWFLFGREPTDVVDPALDSIDVAYGNFHLDRNDVRPFVRFLERGGYGDGVTATFGRPPEKWIKPGDYTIVVFRTAGDPTVPSGSPRYWQVAAEADDAAKSVATTTGDFNPLQGARHLFTYMQLPQDGGDTRLFAGHSDFGSNKTGPDGSQYYNAAANLVVFQDPQEVVFVFPGNQAPGGIRPMSYSPDTGAWDIVSGPGASTAFLPAGGAWPGALGFAGLGVKHDPVSLAAIIDGTPSDGPVEFPSGVPFIFWSPVSDPDQPVLVDLGYTVAGHDVAFDDVPTTPLGSGWHSAAFGLLQYGDYEITGADVSHPVRGSVTVRQAPGDWDYLDELTRQIGSSRFIVDESEGPLGGPSTVEEFFGVAPEHFVPYDPEKAREVLAAAGWLEEGADQ